MPVAPVRVPKEFRELAAKHNLPLKARYSWVQVYPVLNLELKLVPPLSTRNYLPGAEHYATKTGRGANYFFSPEEILYALKHERFPTPDEMLPRPLPGELVTIEDAAFHLRSTVSDVHRWIAAKELTLYEGRQLRVADLKVWATQKGGTVEVPLFGLDDGDHEYAVGIEGRAVSQDLKVWPWPRPDLWRVRWD